MTVLLKKSKRTIEQNEMLKKFTSVIISPDFESASLMKEYLKRCML